MGMLTQICAWIVSVIALVSGQYFPPEPEGLTVVKSNVKEGASISYKQTSICETTPEVKSYAGYVHLPPGALADLGVDQPYPISTFFWFFEARNDPTNAPLSLWLNGGPGASSMTGVFRSHGPCSVDDDSDSTTLNSWSWNNEVSMLYIDQPNQVGFSYDTLINGTLALANGGFPVDRVASDFVQNNTVYGGTFPSFDLNSTANTSMNAGRALYSFVQVWLLYFPEFKSKAYGSVSIWSESYGPRYGLSFAVVSQEENEKIANGTKEGLHIKLDTFGAVSGCVDFLTQATSCLDFAFNNTYDIQAIDEVSYKSALSRYDRPRGCRDMVQDCRLSASKKDPRGFGHDPEVNVLCEKARNLCLDVVQAPYKFYNRSDYDIVQPDPDPFPPYNFLGYLAKPRIQADLGVPVNFTGFSSVVFQAFDATGDYARGEQFLDQLSLLLDSGVKVALVHGDRDYTCNWLGGEKLSLAVEYSNSSAFREAGYTDIKTNSSYIGGQVRQHGNFSFSRVFQAGHDLSAYQSETAYQIFHRAMFNQDIATGQVDTATNLTYLTTGPDSCFQVKQKPPPPAEPVCYLLSYPNSCTDEQIFSIENGNAVFDNYTFISTSSGRRMLVFGKGAFWIYIIAMTLSLL